MKNIKFTSVLLSVVVIIVIIFAGKVFLDETNKTMVNEKETVGINPKHKSKHIVLNSNKKASINKKGSLSTKNRVSSRVNVSSMNSKNVTSKEIVMNHNISKSSVSYNTSKTASNSVVENKVIEQRTQSESINSSVSKSSSSVVSQQNKASEDTNVVENPSIFKLASNISGLTLDFLSKDDGITWSNDDFGLVDFMLYHNGYSDTPTRDFIKEHKQIPYEQSNVGDVLVWGDINNPQKVAMKMTGNTALMLIDGKVEIKNIDDMPNTVVTIN